MSHATAKAILPRRRVGGSLLLLAAVLLAAGCADREAQLAEHLQRGDRYLEGEQYEEAVIEYKSALQLDPNQAGAHYGLARAFLAQKKVKDAYWELGETVRLDPDNRKARLELGALERLAGRPEAALEQADAVLAAEPDNVKALLLRARSLEQLKRPQEARAALEKAVEVAPEDRGPLLLLGALLADQGEREEAERVLRRATEVDPGFETWTALAGFLGRDPEREAEAEAAYRKALELAPPERRELATRLLASFLLTRERPEDAERVLLDALEQDPENLDLRYLLARLYLALGRQDDADRMIESATETRPDDVRPWLVLSEYRGSRGDTEGALAAVERALEVAPEDRTARLRRAELLLELGYREKDPERIAEGRAVVDAVLAVDADDPEALFVRAKVDLAEERPEEALRRLRKALERRPDWAKAHFVLGSALFLSGDRSGARAELSRALEIDSTLVEARRILAQVYASLGEHDLAVEEGRRVLRSRPDDRATRILVAEGLARLGKVAEARAELERIPEAQRDARVLFALGRVALLDGDPEQALAYLRRAAELEPGRPEVLRQLLQVEAAAGELDRAVERIQKAVAADPENPALVRLEGMALLLQGKGATGEARLRRAIELDPADMEAYQLLATYLARTGRMDETIRTYEQAVSAQPNNARLHFVLATLYESQGVRDKAREHYEAAIRVDPEFGVAKNNLAYLLAEEGRDLDRALDLAQEAKALLPDNPSAADTLGYVLLRKGVPSAAIGYLREAEAGFDATRPDLGIVRHHLAQAYEANGEPEKAREVLARALADLDAVLRAAAEEHGRPIPEPPWVAELRSMYERLGGQPTASTEG